MLKCINLYRKKFRGDHKQVSPKKKLWKIYFQFQYSFLLWTYRFITLCSLKENDKSCKMRQILVQIWKRHERKKRLFLCIKIVLRDQYRLIFFNVGYLVNAKKKKKAFFIFSFPWWGYIKLKPNYLPLPFKCAPFCVKWSQQMTKR